MLSLAYNKRLVNKSVSMIRCYFFPMIFFSLFKCAFKIEISMQHILFFSSRNWTENHSFELIRKVLICIAICNHWKYTSEYGMLNQFTWKSQNKDSLLSEHLNDFYDYILVLHPWYISKCASRTSIYFRFSSSIGTASRVERFTFLFFVSFLAVFFLL